MKEFHQKLNSQLKEKIDIGIQQKAFELGNMDNFIKLSEDELKNATDELRIIEEKESGMMKFSREVESSKKLYESFGYNNIQIYLRLWPSDLCKSAWVHIHCKNK